MGTVCETGTACSGTDGTVCKTGTTICRTGGTVCETGTAMCKTGTACSGTGGTMCRTRGTLRMRHLIRPALTVVMLLLAALPAAARKDRAALKVMDKTFHYVERNHLSLGHTESFIYFKFNMQTERHNMATRLIPFVGRMENGRRDYVGESVVKVVTTEPGIVDKREMAFYSTNPYMRNLRDLYIAGAGLSIYQPTLLRDRMLSPANRRNRAYYSYRIDSLYTDTTGQPVERIRVRPHYPNTQLVDGCLNIEARTGRIVSFSFDMTYNTQAIHVDGIMGTTGAAALLPAEIRARFDFRFLHNRSVTQLLARYNHQTILPHRPGRVDSMLRASRHDLTFLNRLNADTTRTDHDFSYFQTFRPVPLTTAEDSVYRAYQAAEQQKNHRPAESKKQKSFLSGSAEDLLLGSHYVHLGQRQILKLPPLITPSMAEWSGNKGLSLRTRLRLSRDMNDGCYLRANFHLGYNFRHGEFFWKTPTEWLFSPRHGGRLLFEVGNGNRIYNSKQAEEVRRRLKSDQRYDSLLEVFNRYRFDYYNDYYIKTAIAYEISNGLNLNAGLVYHVRRLIGWNNEAGQGGIAHRYISLAPRLRLEYTPDLYYYMRRGRKVQLFSRWPTFSLEYERGIHGPHINSQYERWETEANYHLPLYALRSLYLRAGGGLYTKKRNTYFVDYSNFRYNSLPDAWDDEMTGAFEALDRRWYNESRYYVRACAGYESPMLLFARLKPTTRYIKREHIYCNLLCVHALNPYIETGYSVSTHLFDIGAFAGVANHKSVSLGWKFVLRFFEDN